MSKPIIVLDFDGVIHSYKSGWKGARIIPDDPVPGSLKFITEMRSDFNINILSSRSHYFLGRWAMKRWLYKHLCDLACTYEATPYWLLKEIHAFADPWPDQVSWDMKIIVNSIKFPKYKPPAFITIDDRALTFTGEWPSYDEIRSFKPWYK